MPELRLGRLPKVGVARVTIALPERLKEELDLYAAEHGRLYGPVETTALIPHMLEAFLRSDRGWRSRKAKADGARQRRAPLPGSGANRDDETST
ncbi:DUF2274 domain-containing protein [Rhizobium leguminosarum]|uniref:DUF2274 domain-containing protein n=1 Tax=Rhizobium leguminosarum TaxID=384 RepID=UPI00144187CE|nr:DUF2274 domain-containing protein [Rhizobium leguminosarum]NKL53439.1 DUF2274 domain-containing protein [Rhizobium leguminosarum bv. viciae]